jgi:hypothetical protein
MAGPSLRPWDLLVRARTQGCKCFIISVVCWLLLWQSLDHVAVGFILQSHCGVRFLVLTDCKVGLILHTSCKVGFLNSLQSRVLLPSDSKVGFMLQRSGVLLPSDSKVGSMLQRSVDSSRTVESRQESLSTCGTLVCSGKACVPESWEGLHSQHRYST